jgi:hypothetical protein
LQEEIWLHQCERERDLDQQEKMESVN